MIKIAKIANLFGTNGSGEKPNTVVELHEFEDRPNLLVDGDDQKIIGLVILEGDGNYAYCEDNYYFLKRIKVAEREGTFFYSLVKDFGANGIKREVSVKGFCTKTNDEGLILNNIDYVEAVIDNPVKQTRINLSDDLDDRGQDDVVIKPAPEGVIFTRPNITKQDWYNFITAVQANYNVVDKSSNKDKAGVVILAELSASHTVSSGKEKVFKKLKSLTENIKDYRLVKITNLGEGLLKNKYGLTPYTHGGIGNVEETAKVKSLDFSTLQDIVEISNYRVDSDKVYREFTKLDLSLDSLSREFQRTSSSYFKPKVLQRKVYLPLLRRNGATTNDYLYQTSLTPSDKSGARSEDITVTSYTEQDPLVPVYQGCFAQGLTSKTRPTESFWLPFINHLNVSLDWKFSSGSVKQVVTNLNNKILYANIDHPPEFGFLLFNYFKNREDGTWGHYTGDGGIKTLDVLIGLRENGHKPSTTTYVQEVNKGSDRVSKWFANFNLLNSLYPYSGLYYFTAFKDNKVKISFRDGNDGGGTSGFFTILPNKEGEIDFSSHEIKALIQRNIDNNVIDENYIDKVTTQFLAKNAFKQHINLVHSIEKGDIFFNDLRAFWEEPERYNNSSQYGWFYDTEIDHNKNRKNYKKDPQAPQLVYYGNQNSKKYEIGVYHTYSYKHKLHDDSENDILRVLFKDNNAGTTKAPESFTGGVTEKTVTYHHIKPVKNIESKRVGTPQPEFTLASFTAGAKTKIGESILRRIDRNLALCKESYQYKSQGYVLGLFAYEPYPLSFRNRYELNGVEHILWQLPKIGSKGNYDELFNLFKTEPEYIVKTLSRDVVPDAGTFSLSTKYGYGALVGITNASDPRYNDVLKFGNGKGVAATSGYSGIKEIYTDIKEGVRTAVEDYSHLLGDTYDFQHSTDFIKRIDTEAVQRDIYSALNLLTKEGLIEGTDKDIARKTFDLVGTDYGLYIDQEYTPHLAFKPQGVKTDLQLTEEKVFRIKDNTPRQDYIDIVNQKTSVQVITTAFPIEERIVFTKHLVTPTDEEDNSKFKLTISRFNVEGKLNFSDYYIIQYRGARQLIDLKVTFPKRTLSETTSHDLIALEELSFAREKGREELKNRAGLYEGIKARELAQFSIERQKLAQQSIMTGLELAYGLGSFGGGLSVAAGSLTEMRHALKIEDQRLRELHHDRQIYRNRTHKIQAALSTQPLASGLANIQEIGIRAQELQEDVIQKANEHFYKNQAFEIEHTYNEKHHALQIAKLGNVFEQGEVNERDIIDQYNKQFDLNEVHLIYRTPSDIQKEGIKRHYQLYGANCQIPDVSFTFSRNMPVGAIYGFGYIDEFVNLGETEEKDYLRNLLFSGVKILELRPIPKVLPQVIPWSDKFNVLLNEATPEERQQALLKLKDGIDHIEVIKELANHLGDKNKLMDVLLTFFDKPSIYAKLSKTDAKEDKTAYVLKILHDVDEDKIFNAILENKDKQKLVEEGIDNGSKFLRVIGDKHPDQVVSKNIHDDKIQEKENTIKSLTSERDGAVHKAKAMLEKYTEAYNTAVRLAKDLEANKTKLDRANQDLKDIKQRLKDTNQALTQEKTNLRDIREQRKTLESNYANLQKKISSKEEENKAQKQQIDSQIVELEKLKKELETKKDYDEIKKKLSEVEASLEAVRKIEQFDTTNLPNKYAYSLLNHLIRGFQDYNKIEYPLLYDVSEKDYRYITTYRGNSQYRIFVRIKSDKTIKRFKLGGGSGDLGFYWKFNDDSYRNERLRAIGESGSATDQGNTLASINSDPKSYDNAVYIGEEKVILSSYVFRLPAIYTDTEVTEKSSLRHTIYFHHEKGGGIDTDSGVKEKEKENEGIVMRNYGDYLSFLGCKGDPINKKVIPKNA